MRVLVVEDTKAMAEALAKGLREQGYAVDIALDGEKGLELAEINPYDVIVLDVVLPGADGLSICRSLREQGSAVPLLMLTARDAVRDRVAGLDAGADDYLVKPFAFAELVARIRALLRRRDALNLPQLKLGDLTLDTASHEVRRGSRIIRLTAKEYSFLEFLLVHAGEVVSRERISEHVWDESFDPFSNLIEVYIQRLRRKVDANSPVKLIHTIRGAGYMLSARRGERQEA